MVKLHIMQLQKRSEDGDTTEASDQRSILLKGTNR